MRMVFSIVAALFLQLLVTNPVRALTAPELLERVDQVRNPQEDYQAAVRLTSFKPNKEPQESTFQVMVSGRDKTIIQILTPARDRGRAMLMKGTALWAYMPTTSKPVRIPLRERLLGEVSNADVARANFSGDYTPELLGMEDSDDGTLAVLKLKANSNDIPYDSIKLWVNPKSFHPQRAEFYTVSGKLMKTCEYKGYKELGGSIRPTQLVMSDPLTKGQYTIVDYEKIDVRPIPEKYFNDEYLRKLSRS